MRPRETEYTKWLRRARLYGGISGTELIPVISGSGSEVFGSIPASSLNLTPLSGDFPNDNIIISEDGGLLLDPDEGGVSNIIIGNGTALQTVSGNSSVLIGNFVGQSFGVSAVITQNGDFADGSDGWTTTGWTVANGKATHTPGNTSPLRQVVPIFDGQAYTMTFTVSGRTAGSTVVKLTGDALDYTGATRTTNADFSQSLRCPGPLATNLDFVPSTDFDGSISLVEMITLLGRSSVMIGHANSQYAMNVSSHTSTGAYASQGQETDPDTGEDISGTHPLNGTDNSVYGEAAGLHMIGSSSGNSLFAFNAGFNLTTGSQNCLFGIASGTQLTTQDGNSAFGAHAYRYGFGPDNSFFGKFSGYGTIVYTTLSAPVTVGDKTLSVVDASIFAVNGKAVANAILPPDTTVLSINLGANTITLDKASWKTTTGTESDSFIYSIPSAHTGTDCAGFGQLSLFKIQGAATRVTAMGARAGQNNTTGSRNTYVGTAAGDANTTGSDNIVIGENEDASGATVSGEINLGGIIFGTGRGTATKRAGILTNAPSAALDVNSDIIRLRTAKTPTTAGASGNAGDICWDSSFVYVCVSSNAWKRAAIATW